MHSRVKSIVDETLAGNLASRDDVIWLLGIETGTAEAAYIEWGARLISERASGGYGQIFCQIGIDSNPCPADCIYCSYAQCNSAINDPYELDVDEIVEYAKLYDKLGVHLLSIMCTSAYSFDKYCEVIEAVRANVSDDLPIMANLGDINAKNAAKVRSLGVQAAYHVVRINEGKITRISPATRMRTIDAWKQTGAHLTSCVEPYYTEAKPQDVADAMEGIIATEPLESRVMSLIPVAGSAMEEKHGVSMRRRGLINDIYRLMAGERIPFGGSDNTIWVNCGANPKGRTFSKDPRVLAEEFNIQKRLMAGREWTVTDRPLPIWFSQK